MSHKDDLSFLAPPGEVADWRLVAAFDAAAEVGLFEELPATPREAATYLGLPAFLLLARLSNQQGFPTNRLNFQ